MAEGVHRIIPGAAARIPALHRPGTGSQRSCYEAVSLDRAPGLGTVSTREPNPESGLRGPPTHDWGRFASDRQNERLFPQRLSFG